MKSLSNCLQISLIVSGIVLLSSCEKEQSSRIISSGDPNNSNQIVIENKQNSLLIKHSGTYCGPCGSWGWQVYEAIMDSCQSRGEGRVVFISAYDDNFVSNELITPEATQWANNWNLNSWPSFITNGVREQGGTYLIDYVYNVLDDIDAKNAEMPLASLGFKSTIVGDTAIFETKTKFFDAITTNGKKYYMNIYAIEDSVRAGQYGHPQNPNVDHHVVLRKGVGTTTTLAAWGEQISSSDTIATGAIFNKTLKMALDNSWNMDRVEFVGIIWEKATNGKYKFVNIKKY